MVGCDLDWLPNRAGGGHTGKLALDSVPGAVNKLAKVYRLGAGGGTDTAVSLVGRGVISRARAGNILRYIVLDLLAELLSISRAGVGDTLWYNVIGFMAELLTISGAGVGDTLDYIIIGFRVDLLTISWA